MLMTPAEIAAQLPYWAAIPFVVILLLIALMPALAPHWWGSNRNRGAEPRGRLIVRTPAGPRA